ncbi:phosphoribosyltransferase [Agromyces sp. ZXT2-6]|uniref:phosphoribosyltransferase n=1 Tax=Agromyces sp. ZXT2-6 TaxID=3461153 RepID=UPI0040550708
MGSGGTTGLSRFADRRDAGRRLAEAVRTLAIEDAVVLGLPRGGVPVADEVARAIGAPLDVLVVRKLGLPSQPEVAMGAIGEEGAEVANEDVVGMGRVSAAEFAAVERRERAELDARVRRFRGDRAPLPIAGRTALIVDDGVATGATARVACRVARARGAARVVLAVPVGSPRSIESIPEADEVVCVQAPPGFMSVGMHYLDFRQTPDDEVAAILAAAHGRDPGGAPDSA